MIFMQIKKQVTRQYAGYDHICLKGIEKKQMVYNYHHLCWMAIFYCFACLYFLIFL